MSIQSTKLLVPPRAAQPQGAVWAPALLAGLTRTGRAVWRELEAIGQARANRELQRMAQQYAYDPVISQALANAMRNADEFRRTSS